jgi:hypothetical protein
MDIHRDVLRSRSNNDLRISLQVGISPANHIVNSNGDRKKETRCSIDEKRSRLDYKIHARVF